MPIRVNSITLRTMKGLVIKSTGSFYTVMVGGETMTAKLRGALRLTASSSTSPVVVGDIVSIVQDSDLWVIDGVEDRKNYIIRRSTNLSREKHIIAANIDCLYLVVSLAKPQTSLEFIDRVLAAAEAYNIEAKIVVNKIDIAPPTDYFLSIYERAGYEILKISATKNVGIDTLKADIGEKKVLFTGNSGVGKSSIINVLTGVERAKTGVISSYHNKGMHTTTFSEIFALPSGGYIIDTPGIKGFGLVDIEKDELYHYFREIMVYSAKCSFYNCTHTHEPGCAVQKAVEDGDIASERYDSYCKIVASDDEKYRK